MAQVTLRQEDIDKLNPNDLNLLKNTLGVDNLTPGIYQYGNTATANNQTTNNQMFGVSGTNTQALTGGALNNITDYIPQAQTLMSTLYGKTPEQQEREDRINTGTMFLNFFTKMAAEASKPGATGLGAASLAGADTAQLFIDKVNKDRARKLKEKEGVVTLASQLYAKDKPTGATKDYTVVDANMTNRTLGTNLKQGEKITLATNQFAKLPPGSVVGFQVPKTSTVKQMGAGDAINYMTEIQATRYLLNKGLSRDNPNFENIRNRLITQDENLLGTPVIISGKPAEINFTSKDGSIIDAVISQIKGSDKTDYAQYKTKKLQEIAKKDEDYIQKITRFIPNLQNAMDTLLDPNVKTGGIEATLLPAKQFLKSMFGFKDEDLKDQEFLRSISFQLAPQMRPSGSGSTSDMEFKAYQQAILDLGNSKFSNYLNLYSLKKMTENAIQLAQIETELLLDPKNYSRKYINQKIKEFDKGIFEKFNAYEEEEGKLVPKYDNEEMKEQAFLEYWDNLPRGKVFRNSDEKGQKIVTDSGPYLIKGLSKVK